MAEKPKKQSNRKVVFKRALSLVLLGFFAFTPMVSTAAGCKQESSYQLCDIDALTVKMDTYTGGTQPDNYARVGRDGTLQMSAKVTLATPSSFTIGTDQINANTWGSKTISKFSIGLLPVSEASTKCSKDSTKVLGSPTTFVKCDFTQEKPGPTSGKVDAGGILVNNGFSISGSQFDALGMAAPATNYTRYKLYIYPAMYYGLLVDTQVAYAKSGKEMVVDLYAKQTDATAANANGRPTDIPGYGGTTGSAPNGEEGGPLWGIINKIVGFLLGIIQEIIFALFYFLLVPIIQAMLSIRVYTDTFVSVIYPGWIVLRNVCNIIFIVAIMAIAMGTLLRVEAYKSRSVLIQLILAALLVNFSLVIGQIVLGVADTVQSQFLPNNQEVIRALGKDLMVAYRSTIFDLPLGGYFSDIVKQFIFLIMAAGSFMVFAAIAAFLFIRMIMLWILLMISPLAYAAGALPQTSHYRKEWWTTFLKYAFFTPIMAFFLNMTAIISNTYKSNPIFGSLGVKDTDFGGQSLAGFIFRVGSTLLLIVFLMVALKVAESFSIFGAGEISKFAKGGMFLPAGLAKMGGSALAGKVGQAYSKWTSKKMTAAEEAHKGKTTAAWRTAQFLNFKVAKKAWEERAHEKEQEAYEPAYGQVRDSIGRVIPTEWRRDKKSGKWYKPFKMGQKTFYGRIKQQQMISQKEREWDNADLSEEEKVQAWIAAHHAEDKEAIERLLIKGRHEDGRSIALAKINQLKNEKLIYDELMKKPGMTKEKAAASAEQIAKQEHPATYDAVTDLDHVTEGLKESGLNSEQIGRIVAHFDELGEADRKLRAIGNAVFEYDDRFRAANDLSGFKKMEKEKGSQAMLEELAKLKNVFDESEAGDEETIDLVDKNGVPTGKTQTIVKKLRFTDSEGEQHTITNSSDLDTVVEKTKGLDKASGGNFKYEMTGARKQQSAQKRVDRGDSEAWGSALEPAAFLVQEEDGTFSGFTSYGKRLFQQYSQANINSLKKGRKIQARVLKTVGLYKDKDGDLDLDPEKTKFDVMAEAFELNEDLTEAILMKADLEVAQVAEVRDKVTDAMVDRLKNNKSSLPIHKLGMKDASGDIKTIRQLQAHINSGGASWGDVKKTIDAIIVVPAKAAKP